MNYRFIIVLFLFFPILLIAQKKDSTINCNYLNYPLSSFINELENRTQYTFFYKENMLKNTVVTVNGNDLEIVEALQIALKYTDYSFVLLKPNIIVLVTKEDFVHILPKYVEFLNAADEDKEEATDRFKQKYIRARNPNIQKTIVVGTKSEASNGDFVKVHGKLLSEFGEALIGATLYIDELKKGTATNYKGELDLELKPGKYAIELRCIGMVDTKCILNVYSSGTFTFKMDEEVKSLSEVTINAQQEYKIRGTEVGLDKLSIKSVKELPSLMGEKDIIKISQLLPGVVSVSEGSGGVNVRGGNADQNLFYLNDIQLYNPSHLFGFFSSVNSLIIDDFSIYKGFIPAEYGGRLSSVFAVESRNGNKKKIFGQGAISPISANIEVEGPIIKDKCSFVIGGRTTYSDWILKKLPNENLRNSSVSFYDLSASVDYEINAKNKLNTFFYKSNDKFNLNSLNEYQYANLGVGVNYRHKFFPGLKLISSLVHSKYDFETKDWNNLSEAYSHDYELSHIEAKSEFHWITGEKNQIKFGAGSILYNIDRGANTPIGAISKRSVIDFGNEKGLESSIYFDDKFELTKWAKLSMGLRYSFFNYLGPNDVFIYGENSERNPFTVVDTLNFSKNKSIKKFNKPELRLGLDFKITDFSSIKVSYTEMQQYLFLLSNTYAITPTDQWKMSDYYSKPALSQQAAIGVYKTFPGLGLSISGESYYKKSKNITEIKDGGDLVNTKEVETLTLQGDQRAYGFEFMLAKDEGKLNGWMTYTYSRSFIQVTGENAWEKINNGMEYPSNFDKPHVFNFTANYKFSRRFVFSANAVYSTGRPITLPKSVYYLEGSQYIDYSLRNEYRVPDYFRVDLSLTFEGNLKADKLIHSYWMLNVYNLTGRSNPYTVYFNSENGMIQGYKYSIIGVPIITVSWNFKLGNYSNE